MLHQTCVGDCRSSHKMGAQTLTAIFPVLHACRVCLITAARPSPPCPPTPFPRPAPSNLPNPRYSPPRPAQLSFTSLSSHASHTSISHLTFLSRLHEYPTHPTLLQPFSTSFIEHLLYLHCLFRAPSTSQDSHSPPTPFTPLHGRPTHVIATPTAPPVPSATNYTLTPHLHSFPRTLTPVPLPYTILAPSPLPPNALKSQRNPTLYHVCFDAILRRSYGHYFSHS